MELFGLAHVVALAATVVAAAVLAVAGRRASASAERRIAFALAAVLLSNELVWQGCRVWIGSWDIRSSLPLHLCDAAIVVCLAALLTRNQVAYELAYFWGLGGSVQALVTPSVGASFPDYEFFRYFLSHSGIVFVVSYLTFGRRMRPGRGAVVRTILITAVYMAAVGAIDFLLSANYMFLCAKPPEASLIDLLGPWPWYLVPLTAVGILTIALLYLPYYVVDRRRRSAELPAATQQSYRPTLPF